MLDIKRIKENPDAIKAGMKAKEVDCDAVIDKILELDVQVRGLKTATETLTAQKNKLAKETASSSVRRRVRRSGARIPLSWMLRLRPIRQNPSAWTAKLPTTLQSSRS